MRKSVLTICALLLLSIVVAACGNSGSSNGGGNQQDGNAGNGNANGQKEQVTFWYYFGANEGNLLAQQIEKYNQSQDRYEVVGQYIPFADMNQRLSVGILGNQLPDLVTVDNPDHASYAASGVLADITELAEEWGQLDTYLEGPLNSAIYEGKLTGMPFTTNTLAIFYNVDMFEQAGYTEFPTTWEGFKELASAMTTDGVKGFAFAGQKSEEGTFVYLPWLWSAGGDYDSLDSEQSIQALEYLTSFIKDGITSTEVINLSNSDVTNQFAQGQVAMMINGPWNIAMVEEMNPDLNYAIALLPQAEISASALGGDNIAVIKDGNVEGAWDFLSWLSSKEELQGFLEQTGYFSPRTDISESSDHWKNDEKLSVFMKQLETSKPRGPEKNWPLISTAIQDMIQEAFSLTVSPADAAKNAAQEIASVLEIE